MRFSSIIAKKIFLSFLGFQVFFLILLLASVAVVNHLHKSSLAEAVSLSLRRSIITDDKRTVVNELNGQVGVNFEGVSFVSNSNGVIEFSVPAKHALLGSSQSFFSGRVDVPIIYSDSSNTQKGILQFSYRRFEYSGYIFVLWILSAGFFLFIMKREQKKVAETHAKELELQKVTAIARTTQSLAHDVRKPYTMIKMLIEAVFSEDDPVEAKHILQTFLPEVEQAIVSVDSMVHDVMEISSASKLQLEPTNPETLIEVNLNDTLRFYPDADVFIQYDFGHSHKVTVDTLKIGRVFSNIIGNAVQAMKQRGTLWFKTKEIDEDGTTFLQLCIGNSGSYISAEHLPKLFDAFFTSGKQGGTGLGLAIAHKIVVAHGGRIWCESRHTEQNPNGQVEFYFTLPMSSERSSQFSSFLLKHSKEIVAALEKLRKSNGHSVLKKGVDTLEVALEGQVSGLVARRDEKPVVLIADDEGIYRNLIASLILRTEALRDSFSLLLAGNATEVEMLLKTHKPLVLILDVDLGPNSINGIELLKNVRAAGYGGFVCIHSNESLSVDVQTALNLGADLLLPKPMDRKELLKLLWAAVERDELLSKDHHG